MGDDDLDRVQELFERTRALPENEREIFLRDQCGDDHELYSEVRSLLDHHEPEFLEDPEHLNGIEERRRAVQSPPKRIGPYRIVRSLGRGGMGTVYLAEQEEPVRRHVALKLIKPGMDTEQVVARFKSERQALALMNHPAIAQVFDAGSTSDGRPYFVMEYVPGVPITDHCDGERLPNRDRLLLFMKICDGIQHAHQKGIIHRDIKASNILVAMRDGKAVPKIIDFGIAKATDPGSIAATAFTELGQIIGTPEYMSPEQADLTGAGGDIDTRTDVYSLGVLLYELIVGAFPFDSGEMRRASLDELRRKIREDDPPRPSARFTSLEGETPARMAHRRGTEFAALARQLKGDLDWIAMKALERDRRRRYSSASELAADVGRYLANETVTARPPGTAYRMGKFVRRHRIGVSFVALLLVALLLGLVGTGIGLVRANREARTNEVLAGYVIDVFRRVNPETRAGILRVDDLVDRGREKIDELDGQPRVQGRFMLVMGRIYRALSRYDVALPLLEEALPPLRESYGATSAQVVDCLNEIANLAQVSGDFEKAKTYYEQALPLAEKVWGPADPDVAEVLKNLGDTYLDLGDLGQARRLHQRALDVRLEALGPDHPKVAASTTSIARILAQEGDVDGAIEMHRRSVVIRERAYSPSNMGLGFGYYYLADTLNSAGRYAEARVEYQRALDAWEISLPENHEFIGQLALELAQAQERLEEYDAAGACFRRALGVAEAAYGPDSAKVVQYLEGYAVFLRERGDTEEAERLESRAARLEKAPG